MSDSRITQAKVKVRAALDLIAEAGGLIDELLAEDPAFTEEVSAALQRANSRAHLAANEVLMAHVGLRTADRIENREVA